MLNIQLLPLLSDVRDFLDPFGQGITFTVRASDAEVVTQRRMARWENNPATRLAAPAIAEAVMTSATGSISGEEVSRISNEVALEAMRDGRLDPSAINAASDWRQDAADLIAHWTGARTLQGAPLEYSEQNARDLLDIGDFIPPGAPYGSGLRFNKALAAWLGERASQIKDERNSALRASEKNSGASSAGGSSGGRATKRTAASSNHRSPKNAKRTASPAN